MSAIIHKHTHTKRKSPELRKMRRWREFPPNLETKGEWNNTASVTYYKTKKGRGRGR